MTLAETFAHSYLLAPSWHRTLGTADIGGYERQDRTADPIPNRQQTS
jgi:hypothetical protein